MKQRTILIPLSIGFRERDNYRALLAAYEGNRSYEIIAGKSTEIVDDKLSECAARWLVSHAQPGAKFTPMLRPRVPKLFDQVEYNPRVFGMVQHQVNELRNATPLTEILTDPIPIEIGFGYDIENKQEGFRKSRRATWTEYVFATSPAFMQSQQFGRITLGYGTIEEGVECFGREHVRQRALTKYRSLLNHWRDFHFDDPTYVAQGEQLYLASSNLREVSTLPLELLSGKGRQFVP